MTINSATVEQINVALLDIDKKLKALNIDSATVKSLQSSVKNIKSSLNETKAGLTSGATYDINISGNASTATSATTATSAAEADHAETADTAARATEADHATSADTVAAGGTSGQVLTSNGSSTTPSWQDQKLNTKVLYSGSYSTANGSIALSDSIENYSALAVMATMYGGTEQMVPVFIPKETYYWIGAGSYRKAFLLSGSTSDLTRRIGFGFLASSPTTLYTGVVEGNSAALPSIKYVIGIK